MKENVSGCFFSEHSVYVSLDYTCILLTVYHRETIDCCHHQHGNEAHSEQLHDCTHSCNHSVK